MRIYAICSGGITTDSTAPVAGTAVSAFTIDTDGNIVAFGTITPYNIDPVNAVPASALMGLECSPGGHWYVTRYAGRPIPVTPLLGQSFTVPPGW